MLNNKGMLTYIRKKHDSQKISFEDAMLKLHPISDANKYCRDKD